MLSKNEGIYSASGEASKEAKSVLFPIGMTINRPTCAASLAEAQKVIEQFQAELTKHQSSDVALQRQTLSTVFEDKKAKFDFVREGKNGIKLEIDFFVALTLNDDSQFWERIGAISRSADILFELCEIKRGKEIELVLGRAILPNDKEGQERIYAK